MRLAKSSIHDTHHIEFIRDEPKDEPDMSNSHFNIHFDIRDGVTFPSLLRMSRERSMKFCELYSCQVGPHMTVID